MSSTKLDAVRRRATTDFYFFCKEVLGYSKMTKRPHQELCDFITNPNTPRRKKLVLMPRNSFKSSVVTVGGALWSLVRNPNLRILVTCATQKNALKYLKEMKDHIEGNEKFRALFGDWVNRNGTWRDMEFTISKRKQIKKEPSVMPGSLEKGALVGMHVDLILADDTIGPESVNTPEQILKSIDYYRLILSVLDPKGRIWMTGTRWHWMDLYGWILDPANGERDQYDIMVKDCFNEDGSLLMPEVLSKEFLDEQRRTQGEYVFNCQYRNRALSDETSTFKQAHIRFYEELPKRLNYYMSIDPAVSKSGPKTDFSAIVVIGIDEHNNWYVCEALELKLEPSDLIDTIFEVAQKYAPIWACGMEKYVAEKFLASMLAREMETRSFYFPIKQIATDNRKSKDMRIRSLQPMFEQKKIYLKKEHESLIFQITTHPQLRNDDLIDALKNFLSLALCAPDKLEPSPDEKHLSSIERQEWAHVRSMDSKRRVRRVKWKAI